MIQYQHCPVCSSNDIYEVLHVRDHTVSREQFSVWHCRNCTLRFTQSVPGAVDIGPYYQSGDYISHSDTKNGLPATLLKARPGNILLLLPVIMLFCKDLSFIPQIPKVYQYAWLSVKSPANWDKRCDPFLLQFVPAIGIFTPVSLMCRIISR